MLSQSDVPIVPIMKELASFGIEAGYLVPTPTGLRKGIMDAHAAVRTFLKIKGIHDFDTQQQGDAGKVVLDVGLLDANGVTARKMSLYRPRSKDGDPRIWIYGLPDYASAWNLLVLLVVEKQVFVFNASNAEVFESRNTAGSPLVELLKSANVQLDEATAELTGKLRHICSEGFIDSLKHGATGVGFTLESLLGIRSNSRRTPDYKGIELKSARVGESLVGTSRSNLFSKVPNWKLSFLKSSKAILLAHGYNDSETGRLQLYHTLKSRPNSLGLYLRNEEATGLLHSVRNRGAVTKEIACWQYSTLMKALADKHRRTFWVKARNRVSPIGVEQFHYVEVVRTEAPLTSNLPTLVEIDAVSVDFTLYQEPSGSFGDHGYLFKLHPSSLDLLFPPSVTMSLS